MKPKRSTKCLACTAMVLAAISASMPLAQAHDHGAHASSASHQSSPKERKRASELVRVVREATARYRDVRAAEADNYNLLFGCVSGAEWGAMGLHYVNLELAADGKLDPMRPEIVIYEPLPNGGRKIVGADYLVFAADWDASKGTPILNGQLMHLIDSPNRYGLPAFYTLHVWAWKDNPNGAFVNWHPKVSCDDFEG
jgi:hypothetical protein